VLVALRRADTDDAPVSRAIRTRVLRWCLSDLGLRERECVWGGDSGSSRIVRRSQQHDQRLRNGKQLMVAVVVVVVVVVVEVVVEVEIPDGEAADGGGEGIAASKRLAKGDSSREGIARRISM